jgi:hypothetical protein
MGAGSAVNTRERDDFYETPDSATEQFCIVERAHLPPFIWEPSSGRGAITRVLRRHGIRVVESDLISRVGQQQLDFLKAKQALAPAIVTNPPFKIAAEYVVQTHKLGVPYLALLLKLGFLATRERQKLFSQIGHPTRVWVLADRPDFLGQGAPTMDCAWFVWDEWHAPHSIVRAMPLDIPIGDRRSKKARGVEVNNNGAATRTAARLLCQYPSVDLGDRDQVIARCMEFKVDLRAQNIGYDYENVKRAVRQLRAEAATVAGTSWTPDDLREKAQKLYDPQRNVEEQVAEFYAAQARYQIMKAIRNGDGARG